MGLVFVGDRCDDHSPSSGYDRVTAQFPTAAWLSGRALERDTVVWHRPPAVDDDTNPIFHVLYGDCSGRRLPALLRRRHPDQPIVATVHKPADRLVADPDAHAALDLCDALIGLTASQADQLRANGVRPPIIVIPHGVSFDAFGDAGSTRPGPASGPILVVGTFLRDWQFARDVLAEPRLRHRDVLAIGAIAQRELLGMPPNVRFTTRLDEPELAAHYRGAAAVFLPVIDGTASNALLEAMAAGCPVVCPRLPGFIDDYLGDDEDSYRPGDVQSALDALERTADTARRRRRAGLLARRAHHFDWSNLRQRFIDAYGAVGHREPIEVSRQPPDPVGVA